MECHVAIKNYDIDLCGLIQKDISQYILLREKHASGHLIYIALFSRYKIVKKTEMDRK